METQVAITTLTTMITMIGITALIGTNIPKITIAAEANHQHPLSHPPLDHKKQRSTVAATATLVDLKATNTTATTVVAVVNATAVTDATMTTVILADSQTLSTTTATPICIPCFRLAL